MFRLVLLVSVVMLSVPSFARAQNLRINLAECDEHGFEYEVWWTDDRGVLAEWVWGYVESQGCNHQAESLLWGGPVSGPTFAMLVAWAAGQCPCGNGGGGGPDPDPDPECPSIDTSLAGRNCCPAGEGGAFYYIATGEDGCPYLACSSGACRPLSCTDAPQPLDPCIGSWVATTGEDGCIASWECKTGECIEPYPPAGTKCECAGDAPREFTGTVEVYIPDGEECPVTRCKCPGGDCRAMGPNGLPHWNDGTSPYQNCVPFCGSSEGDEVSCGRMTDQKGHLEIDNSGACPRWVVVGCEFDEKDSDCPPGHWENGEGQCVDCDVEIAEVMFGVVDLVKEKFGLTTGIGLGTPGDELSLSYDLSGLDLGNDKVPNLGGAFHFNLLTMQFGGDIPRARFGPIFESIRTARDLFKSVAVAFVWGFYVLLTISTLFK